MHQEDVRFDLNRVVILTDMFLTALFFILFFVEKGQASEIQEKAMPVIIISRAYLKLPFAYCLILHYLRIKEV